MFVDTSLPALAALTMAWCPEYPQAHDLLSPILPPSYDAVLSHKLDAASSTTTTTTETTITTSDHEPIPPYSSSASVCTTLSTRISTTTLLWTLASFSTHQVRSFYASIYTLALNGAGRPSWDYASHIIFQMIRSAVSYGGATLPLVRYLTEAAGTPMPPPGVAVTEFRIQVNMEQMRRFEKDGEIARLALWGAAQCPDVMLKESRQYWQDIGDEITVEGEWVEQKIVSVPEPQSSGWFGSWFSSDSACSQPSTSEPSAAPQESSSEKVIYYLHGGAYILGTAPLYRHLTGRIAMKTNTRIFAINYRKAPEHPFPAALYDAFIGYCWLTMPDHPMFMNRPYDHTPVHPSNVVLMGDSAGGGLCMALLNYLNLYLRSSTDHATPMVPLPGGGILLSPWVDLTFSSESWRSNMAADWLPDATDIHSPVSAHLPHPVHMLLYGKDSYQTIEYKASLSEAKYTSSSEQTVRDAVTRFSKHPLLSPLHAPTFAKLPPLLVQSGDAEVLRDESILLAQKYDNDNTGHAGCEGSWVRHELYRDMVHVFMAFPGLRQSTVAIERWGRFLDQLSTGPGQLACQGEKEGWVVVDSHTGF
ncbi:hypothetical protein HDU85_004086 [Gaertneriomyces sp. JEL0708]|nr:hypothetical protein HDU85_004086 [Gaertneriomyces sp. JEL0708]